VRGLRQRLLLSRRLLRLLRAVDGHLPGGHLRLRGGLCGGGSHLHALRRQLLLGRANKRRRSLAVRERRVPDLLSRLLLPDAGERDR